MTNKILIGVHMIGLLYSNYRLDIVLSKWILSINQRHMYLCWMETIIWSWNAIRSMRQLFRLLAAELYAFPSIGQMMLRRGRIVWNRKLVFFTLETCIFYLNCSTWKPSY